MISNKKIHYKLPIELYQNTTQENIFNWCKNNKLADNVKIIRTGKSIDKVVSGHTVSRRKIFERMFEKKVSTVREVKEIAKNLKKNTKYEGMADIVLALVRGYIAEENFVNRILYGDVKYHKEIKENDSGLEILAGLSNDQIDNWIDSIVAEIDDEKKKL